MSTPCVSTVAGLRPRLYDARSEGCRIGFVPTMGSLHAGHLSLIDRAREDGFALVSIFVNPLQFGPHEDFRDYPRGLEQDLRVCAEAGVGAVFAPTRGEMYPTGFSTRVAVGGLSGVLCGASRPGHFEGVATVLAKLFAIVGECTAYFGRKDFQQLVVTRRLARDLSLPVRVVGCPTVREADGLAMSSRNALLSPDERAQAPALRRALGAGIDRVRAGETDPSAVRAAMRGELESAWLAEVDYTAVVSAADLTTPDPITGEVRLLVAAKFGSTRLIDNAGCAAPAALSSPR